MENNDLSRRGFLKTLGIAGAALTIEPAFNKVQAATAIVESHKSIIGNNTFPHRTLGSGKAAFEVSALGFGVMGMTYNRSQHPDKKQCIRLTAEEWSELETAVAAIPVVGDRYNAEQQRQVGR